MTEQNQTKKNNASGRTVRKSVSRIAKLEKSIGDIQKQQNEILKFLKNQTAQKEDYEQVPGRQPQEEGDVEEEEKKKELGSKENMNASPEGGDEKLPKAPVGETGENAKVESGSVNLSKEDVRKQMEEVLQEYGIKKTETPRPQQSDVQKDSGQGQTSQAQNSQGKSSFTMELLKKVRSGEISQADMNREIKKKMGEQNQQAMQQALDFAKQEAGETGGEK